MRNFLTFVAVALVTALTVALVAPPFIDWSARRQLVAHAIAARIGAPVDIGGPITLRLLPTPYLQVGEVKIGLREAPWLQGKAMRFEFALANLIEGKIRLDDVVFDRPQIHVGPVFATPSADGRLEFGHIRASHAEIVVERTTGSPLVLHDLNFDGAARSATGSWRGSGDFSASGETRASFQIASETPVADSLPLRADFAWQSVRAQWDGRVILGSAPSFAGDLTLSGEADAAEGAHWPWRLAGAVAGAGGEATLADAELRLGAEARSIEAKGRIALRFGETAEFEADLQAKTLNFDALMRSDSETSAPPARAARAFALLAQRSLQRDAPFARFSIKLQSVAAYLGARSLENCRLAFTGAAGEPMQISLASGLPGQGEIKLDGGLELGVAPIFRGHAFARTVDFAPLAAWVAQDQPALKSQLAGLGAALPVGEISVSGDVELSSDGYAARGLTLGVANSHFEGGGVYRLASASAPGRLFLDLSSDTLDIDAAPNVEAGLDWLGDTDLDFRLKARRLRVARVGLASVESGSLDVHALKSGRKFTLERLSLADFGGASIQAEGETSPTGRWTRVKLDAAHLSDFAALLIRAAPSPQSRWLLARADDLGAAKATFEARRDGPPASGPLPLDLLKAEGVIAASRFNLTLSRAPAPVNAVSAQFTLDSPDAGALMRKLGARISPAAAGRGELALSGTGQWDRGFEGKARLALAGAELIWSGALHPQAPESWLSGPLTLKAADVMPALAALGVATPGTGVVVPADLSTTLQAGPEGAHLTKLAGVLAGSRVTGELALSPPPEALSVEELVALTQPEAAAKSVEPPPVIAGALEFDRGSLSGLLSLALGRFSPSRPGVVWAETKFGPPLLQPPSLDLKLRIGAFDTLLGLGRGFAGRLRAERDRLALEDFALSLNGGDVGGRLELRRSETEAIANGAVKLQGVGFERPNGRGRVDVSLDFAGAGASAAALVGGLAGAGQMKIADTRIAHFDPEALTRAFAKIEAAPNTNLEAKTLESLIGMELEKGPLTLAAQESPLTLSSAALRFGPLEAPAAEGSTSLSGDVRLADGALDLEARLVHAKVGRFWNGPSPMVVVTAKGALDAPVRKIDAALLSAGLSSEAIARETERMENFEADVRERAMFNRRRKAELFLARREAEIDAWEAEQERRQLMERYISEYEAWAASRNAAP